MRFICFSDRRLLWFNKSFIHSDTEDEQMTYFILAAGSSDTQRLTQTHLTHV